MTMIESRQNHANIVRNRVCELLQFGVDFYNERQYALGLAYLEMYLPATPQLRRQLEASKYFWAWWRNLCVMLDQSFIETHNIDCISFEKKNTIYESLYCINNLVIDFKPTQLHAEMLLEVAAKKEVLCQA